MPEEAPAAPAGQPQKLKLNFMPRTTRQKTIILAIVLLLAIYAAAWILH